MRHQERVFNDAVLIHPAHFDNHNFRNCNKNTSMETFKLIESFYPHIRRWITRLLHQSGLNETTNLKRSRRRKLGNAYRN